MQCEEAGSGGGGGGLPLYEDAHGDADVNVAAAVQSGDGGGGQGRGWRWCQCGGAGWLRSERGASGDASYSASLRTIFLSELPGDGPVQLLQTCAKRLLMMLGNAQSHFRRL